MSKVKRTCPEQSRRIAVTGGKGGVGKSTVSVLLANKLKSKNKKVILVDCDVECPNDHLLLGKKIKKPVKMIFAQFPKLNREKCERCGLCVQKCRSNAIFQTPGQPPIFIHQLCSGCGLCWHICPNKAIKIERKLIGKIFENRINDNFYLVSGRSVGVVDETGPIVSKTRKYALKLAEKIEADYVLFDTAVGLHCGVIRALIDTDLAYAVTEPTPLGVHDLKLILNLLKVLKVPAEIVINQADLGNKKLIDEIAKNTKIKIAHKIPYSKKLVKAYSEGNLLKLSLL